MEVRLRDVAAQDSARLLAWRNSREVAVHMVSDHQISQAEHDAWFAAIPIHTGRRFWLIEVDGEPAGLTNLSNIDREARRCEWGYYLGDPAVRGRGAGSCVEYMVLRHVFEVMGFNRVWCEVLAGNTPSLRLLETIGFQREGTWRQHAMKGGVFVDLVGLGLLAAEWPAAKTALEARLRRLGVEPANLAAVA